MFKTTNSVRLKGGLSLGVKKVFSRSSPCSRAVRNHGARVPCCMSQVTTLSRRSLGLGLTSLFPMTVPGLAAAVETANEQDPKPVGFEDRVHEFTLPNGLHFIILERHTAPVVSCHIHANVGAFDEVDGQTGVAHLLEHMSFKGTQRIGTHSYKQEAPLLDALDEVFYDARELRRQGQLQKALVLEERLAKMQAEAEQLVIPNAYGALLQQQGAVGLNASTSQDNTVYFTSLPSNKLELWFALEAERFQAPVFRELYSEKRVVLEERAMRVDNAPNGRWQEAFARASLSSNYSRPVIGYADDIAALGRREVSDFFARYYAPPNLTIAIVGDVTASKAQQFAEKYFGSWNPSGFVQLPKPSAEEPLPQPEAFVDGSVRQYSAPSKAGPLTMLGYYRPPMTSDDGIVLEVISDILSGSRISRLQSHLVETDRAIAASCSTGYPGDKHAGMTLVYGIPRAGDSVETLGAALKDELSRLCSEGVSTQELQRVKKNARGVLLSALQSNKSMATALASYHTLTGSWRGLTRELELVQALTPEQVVAVAQKVFADANCFTGYVLPATAA